MIEERTDAEIDSDDLQQQSIEKKKTENFEKVRYYDYNNEHRSYVFIKKNKATRTKGEGKGCSEYLVFSKTLRKKVENKSIA